MHQPFDRLAGVLPINKPRGMTSKDVSRVLQRSLGRVKLGHVGTLDPDAEGVLPVLFGTATRVQDLLLDSPKTYWCQIFLGETTDTLDREGTVTATAPWEHVTLTAAQEAAAAFLGPIEQIPPAFSAVKHKGKALYAYARQETLSEEFLATFLRKVEIYALSLDSLEGNLLSLRMTCSKGTYVRSLVRDLCTALGTCGRVDRLVREAASGFLLNQTVPLDSLDEARMREVLVPIHRLTEIPQLAIHSTEDVLSLLQGKELHSSLCLLPGTSIPSKPFLLVDSERAFGIGTCIGKDRIRLQRSL